MYNLCLAHFKIQSLVWPVELEKNDTCLFIIILRLYELFIKNNPTHILGWSTDLMRMLKVECQLTHGHHVIINTITTTRSSIKELPTQYILQFNLESFEK